MHILLRSVASSSKPMVYLPPTFKTMTCRILNKYLLPVWKFLTSKYSQVDGLRNRPRHWTCPVINRRELLWRLFTLVDVHGNNKICHAWWAAFAVWRSTRYDARRRHFLKPYLATVVRLAPLACAVAYQARTKITISLGETMIKITQGKIYESVSE